MAQPTEVPEVPDPRSVEVDWSAAELYEPKPEYRRDFASKVYEVARIPGFDGYRIRAQGRRQHKGEVHTGQQVEHDRLHRDIQRRCRLITDQHLRRHR